MEIIVSLKFKIFIAKQALNSRIVMKLHKKTKQYRNHIECRAITVVRRPDENNHKKGVQVHKIILQVR